MRWWGTCSAVIGLGLWACSGTGDPETKTGSEAPPDPPEACVSGWDRDPLCSYAAGNGASLDAGGGMGGTVATSPGEECWVASQASLACPSKVGVLDVARSKDEGLNWLVGLVGIAGVIDNFYQEDKTAYLYAHELEVGGETVVDLPNRTMDIRPDWSLILAGATEAHDSFILSRSDQDPAGSELEIASFPSTVAGKSLALSTKSSWHSNVTLDSRVSAALFLEPGQGLSIVQDLKAPTLIEPTQASDQAVMAPDASGDLLLLTEHAGTFRLFSGESLDNEIGIWTGGSTTTPRFLDYRSVGGPGGMQGVILVGDSEPYLAKIDDSGSAPLASLHRGPSTCESVTIGITCDNCPDGTLCEVWTDRLKKGALMERNGRLFAVYVAAEELSERRMTRHTNLTGLGCTCNPDELDSNIMGTSLVVKEVLYQEGGLQTVTRMRTRLPTDWQTSHTDFVRDADGNLDLVLGPSLFTYRDGLSSFPDDPETYRVLQIVAPE